MCGKTRTSKIEKINPEVSNQLDLKEHLEKRRWVVQFNGEHIDTYCCKACAK